MRNLPILLLAAICLAGCGEAKRAEKPADHLPHPKTPGEALRSANPLTQKSERPSAEKTKLPSRNPHQSLLGRWIDGEGVVYNFQKGGKLTWTRTSGTNEVDFKGKYTVTEGVLVVVPEGAGSGNADLKKQLKPLNTKHRLTQYTLTWQPNDTVILVGPDGDLALQAIR